MDNPKNSEFGLFVEKNTNGFPNRWAVCPHDIDNNWFVWCHCIAYVSGWVGRV